MRQIPSTSKKSTPTSNSKPKPPFNAYAMTATLKNLYYKLSSPSTPNFPSPSTPKAYDPSVGFTKAPTATSLFPPTNPDIDGEDCLHDCSSCTIKYPAKFTIDETEELYGHVKGWSTHLIVATGKTDWVRDVADEEGSIMEAVGKGDVKPENGKLMLSASNIPVPDPTSTSAPNSTTVLLLPAFHYIDNVTPENTPDLIRTYVNRAPTNTSPLTSSSIPPSLSPPTGATTSSGLTTRPCPHDYLILLCSQKTRDARCGQSAPLLRREFERHLRPLGLYRDLHDERPGGVGIYFISHVGGHKFSANVIVYRRGAASAASAGNVASIDAALDKLKVEDKEVVLDVNKEQQQAAANGNGEKAQGEAAQCIWLARIRPEDCENVIKYTVLQGKVVKPERQLRGGFDREKGLVSW